MLKTRGVLPGFGLTLGYTVVYLGFLVILPLSALAVKASSLTARQFFDLITNERALHAYQLSFGCALLAALVNAVFGLLCAWVLVRYQFPGRRLVDAMIDLPFALPTAVAGIALTQIFGPHGWIGEPLLSVGIKVAFAPIGILIALTFIGIPFVVRTVQPVLAELDVSIEEAATILGATPAQTFFKVTLPALTPAVLTGLSLAFARGVGEYGSVVFISGNMPMKTEVLPLLIVTKLEQYDYAGATAIAVVMLAVSFLILFAINMLQRWMARSRA